MKKTILSTICLLALHNNPMFGWPCQLAHYFNKNLNSHIFMISDIHVGPGNSRCQQDQQALLDASKQLNAHLIVEDTLVKIDPLPETLNVKPLDYHCSAEQTLMAILLADPVQFNQTVSYHLDFLVKILSAFGNQNITAQTKKLMFSHHMRALMPQLYDILVKNNKLDEAIDRYYTPLLFLSLAAQANNIHVTNIDWRSALCASIAGYPIEGTKVFESINNTIGRIQSFNDGPILNKFYKDTLDEYQASYNQFQHAFDQIFHSTEPLSRTLSRLPISTIKELILKSVTGVNYLQSKLGVVNVSPEALEHFNGETSGIAALDREFKNSLFADAFVYGNLTDCLIAHHLCQDRHEGPKIVYAGATHIAAIEPLLEQLDYECVDVLNPVVDPQHSRNLANLKVLVPIDLEYYFSHFKDGLRLLTAEEIMNIMV